MCPDCLRDIQDPSNRRFGYPFTNCTNCGPRFTIIEAVPYDRVRTSMKGFTMCKPASANTMTLPTVAFTPSPTPARRAAPSVELWDAEGETLADRGTRDGIGRGGHTRRGHRGG